MGCNRTRCTAAGLLTALALAGCGTGVDDPAHVQARSAVQVFLKLCGEQRGQDLSRLLNDPALAASMRSGDVRRGCATVLRQPSALPAAAYAAARVTTTQTVGDEARVGVQLPGGVRTTVEAEREGDRWWVTNVRLGR